MARIRLALAGTVAVLAATVLLLGGAFSEGSEARPSSTPLPRIVSDRAFAGFALDDTASTVERLQARVRENGRDLRSLTLLGLAYQQRARETGDPSYYPKSAGVLRQALSLRPNDPLATSGLGLLALSQHRFRDALGLGRKAMRLAPKSARNWGIVGDALIELGRYREAFKAFDTMIRLEPDLPAYARISYARELLGRPLAAVRPMQAAIDATGFQREPFAWTNVQLGKLYWSIGRVGAAAKHYRLALAFFPDYVFALDALAQVEAARGRYDRAIALERRAVDAVPLPQFVSGLGDLYAVTGRERLAREQYALIGALERLLTANGVKTNLEISLFNADHGIRLRDTLARARRAHRDAPSIHADDVLGWTLQRNGLCGEALRYSKRALRLGTLDASIFFHRGMIERCLGHDETAERWFRRALALNPHFSLRWAPVARRYAQ